MKESGMAKPRRMGTETSETRVRLLDVTERIMIDDGYAAVSSRRIAKDAGVTPALVHYYFGTLDDLFLAVLRRRADQQLERQRRTISSSPRPLRRLWDVSKDPDGTALLSELMALANHRKIVRSELATYAEQFRKVQLEALQEHLAASGVDLHGVPSSRSSSDRRDVPGTDARAFARDGDRLAETEPSSSDSSTTSTVPPRHP